jgi:hypothetical protein
MSATRRRHVELRWEREDRHLLRGSGEHWIHWWKCRGSSGTIYWQAQIFWRAAEYTISQPESEEFHPLMKKIRTSNMSDILETKMNKREVPLTDEEVRAGQMLQNGATRLYGRTLGSKKKE